MKNLHVYLYSIAMILLSCLMWLWSRPVGHAAEPTWKVKVTSYNPSHAQTDSSPCIGASGVDQCHLAKRGVRIIALSQDLVGRVKWKPFTYYDRVWLKSDVPACNGEFVILDTMNKRMKNRADIFFLDRKQNVGCLATLIQLPFTK